MYFAFITTRCCNKIILMSLETRLAKCVAYIVPGARNKWFLLGCNKLFYQQQTTMLEN